MVAGTGQQPFLVRSRQEELKGVCQHEDEGKLLVKLEGARISHHPLNGKTTFRRFLARTANHFWRNIHPGDLIALRGQGKGHAACATGQVEQRPAKRPRPLLDERAICLVAVVFYIIDFWVSKVFKIIVIDHACPLQALFLHHSLERSDQRVLACRLKCITLKERPD